jgi:hypothetical protein
MNECAEEFVKIGFSLFEEERFMKASENTSLPLLPESYL